jgi:hypothetical protein
VASKFVAIFFVGKPAAEIPAKLRHSSPEDNRIGSLENPEVEDIRTQCEFAVRDF